MNENMNSDPQHPHTKLGTMADITLDSQTWGWRLEDP